MSKQYVVKILEDLNLNDHQYQYCHCFKSHICRVTFPYLPFYNNTLTFLLFSNHYCLLYMNTERRYCVIKMRWQSSSILYFLTKDVYLYIIPIFNESTSCRKHMGETRICTRIGLRECI